MGIHDVRATQTIPDLLSKVGMLASPTRWPSWAKIPKTFMRGGLQQDEFVFFFSAPYPNILTLDEYSQLSTHHDALLDDADVYADRFFRDCAAHPTMKWWLVDFTKAIDKNGVKSAGYTKGW